MLKKNRKLINRIVAVGDATCLAFAILVSPNATVSVQAAASGNEGIQQKIIKWRWKVENDDVYRNIYNYLIGV